MTDEELDKLEAALDKLKNAQSLFGFEQPGIIYEAARAYLAAQRQAPVEDNINVTVEGHSFEKMGDFIAYTNGHKAGWNAHIKACALTNSVPVGAMNKIELALLDSRAVFAILKHDKPDDHPYNLLFENCDKALRELESWVKGVE